MTFRRAATALVLASSSTALLYAAASQTAAPAVQAAPANVAAARATIDKYCVTCHNARTKSGSLILERADLDRIPADAEMWEKVIRKLRTGSMPPAGMPRPSETTVKDVVGTLESTIDEAAARHPNPGRAAIHRLNRAEYVNAIRDLFDLEIDGASLLPADDTSYGFDNIADSLSLTPALLERYIMAAKKISRLAVGDPGARPSVTTYTAAPMRVQEWRMSDDLPAGSRGGFVVTHNFPADAEYVIKLEMQREEGGGVRGRGDRNFVDVRLDGERLRTFTVGGPDAKNEYWRADGSVYGIDDVDKGLILRVPIKAGPRRIGVSFNKNAWVAEGVGPFSLPPASSSFQAATNTTTEHGKIEMGLRTITIDGPYKSLTTMSTPSRARILTCTPASALRATAGQARDEQACARTIVSTLARRGYRRPVDAKDVDTLLGFYKSGATAGGFEAGIQRALEAVLVDPDFLVRTEARPPAPGEVYRISDVDLASRLSFFLWSSIPDDELIDLAGRNRLHEAAVLDQQVRRMLADARSKALVSNFFGQWLSLRALASIQPDPRAFPEFEDNLRDAFLEETTLFLTSQLREDRPVPELLTANYTYLNERLAKHYGVPYVYGSHFRRVTLPDERRAGILGQGSLLTITSYAHRTSPVVRGKWLLDNLLGAPPPPPPANVPPFPEEQPAGAVVLTVREKMEQHRKNPVCASCHARLDPMGFALENFDGVGAWRATEAGKRVDASGAFPDGTKFDTPAAFRAGLMKYREEFLSTVTEKLLTYATGRGAEYYDMPAIRAIVREASVQDCRWSSLIIAVVKSAPFQMRRAES
jgi:hypothetical protein